MIDYGKSQTQSLCPSCNEMVVLLSPIDYKMTFRNRELPAFFICFGCRHIGQVGVGEVKDVAMIEERLGLADLC